MKSVVLILCLFFVISITFAQSDTIQISDLSVKEALAEIVDDQYYRIPKKDYDALLEHEISQAVNDKFRLLIFIVGGLVTVLTGFSIIQTKGTRELIQKQIEFETGNKTTESLKSVEKHYYDSIEPRLEDLKMRLLNEDIVIRNDIQMIRDRVDERLSSIDDKLLQTNTQVKKAKSFLNKLDAERLVEKVKLNNYTELDIESALNILSDIREEEENSYLVPSLVSSLSVIYYKMRKDKELIELIEKYEKFELWGNIYVNGALVALEKYHDFATSFHERDRAIEFLDKAIKAMPTYGTALALKMEINVIEYLRSTSKEEEQTALQNIEKIINDILNSESADPASEAVNRLIVDFNKKYSKYVTPIFEKFPDKMRQLVAKANQKRPANNPYDVSKILKSVV